MSVDFPCPECNRRLRVGPEFAGKKVRCPGCRKVVTAPAGEANIVPSRAAPIPLLDPDPPPQRPEAIAAAPILVEPLDLDARRPAAPAAGEDCCPGCGRFLAPDAVVCLDCGYNRNTGKQLRTVSRRLERTWYLGGFANIPSIFVVAILYVFLGLAAFVSADVLFAALLLLVGVVPSVLLLGTFTRVRITRDREGRPLVIRDRWLSFFPIGHAEMVLEDYQLIRLGHKEGNVNLIILAIMLLLCFFGMVPGFLFWILLFRGSSFTLEIAGEHEGGAAPLVEPKELYRGASEVKMREIGDALQEFAGLRYG